ncbi:uncharacterized protein LOC135697977 [Ochlerotatus camptorhynchus]|uniref:uncharacterized protein LOC135697977 n=1 Tax=Ochlerotatus camptorhynchus TaxID=644619 RepID=UPI0031E268AF
MKVKLTNWFTLVLFFGIISEVYLVSPPYRAPCGGDKHDCDKPTKCPGRLSCQPGEMLVDSPPCCEPTCCDDCSNVKCPLIYVQKPTCVCKPGLVRNKGFCIEPCQCPPKEKEEKHHILPPVTTPKCDDVTYQDQSGGCKKCNSVPVKPPCGCQQNTPKPPCPCQVKPLPCPCQGVVAPSPPCSCYPPPPVAPPSPCGGRCGSV